VLLLLWLGATFIAIATDTWHGLDVRQWPSHGLDTRIRNEAGQNWTLAPKSDDSNYWVTGYESNDTVKTWSDLSQDGQFGISTRIDSIANPPGPLHLDEVVVARDERSSWPPNGSPTGNTTFLPTTLQPGSSAVLKLTWSIRGCRESISQDATYSISSVDVHETVLGIHRTRTLPLGYTLHITKPHCPTL
jgi:hypothetical protein